MAMAMAEPELKMMKLSALGKLGSHRAKYINLVIYVCRTCTKQKCTEKHLGKNTNKPLT